MDFWGKRIWPAMALCLFSWGAWAQTNQPAGCKLEPPVFASTSANIFNDRQEQDLGDALAEYVEPDLHIAPPATDDELTRIGERLLATLPPTGVHYRFRIYDSGDINGFSLAGGRVYISRKLIVAVKNEDELAGVIAHEIGHISTHQSAIEFTRMLRIRLGVTQVTDRADIFAKVHQFFSTPEKPHEEQGKEEKDELVADQVALYAMVRAGYVVESFPEFYNQVSLNKGKTGNWLSDRFGMTHEAAQRYRAAIKQIDVLPAGCKEWQPKERADFQAWRKITMEERVKDQAEGVTGDRPLKLDPPLRPSLWRIRFSPDGRYILAQDESSITVVDKDAGKDLFRIDASDAQGAQFTPDSSSVVFHDDKLRVEQWSVASAKRISVKELVVFDGCTQTLLTQDGKTLMCAKLSSHYGSLRVGIKLIDVESGKSFFEIPNYYEPGYYDEAGGLQALASNFLGGYNIVNVAASPGGRYLIMSAGIKILAYDLQNRQAVALRGKLKDLDQTRITFLGPDQVFVVGKRLDKFFYEGLILSFPDGRLVKKSKIGPEQFAAVTKGQNLLVWPLKDYGIGILDPNQEKISIASKYTAMDAWDNSVATESARGGLELVQLGAQGTKRIPLPLGPLPRPQAAVFSPDGKFLALSMKGRASIWNMETGKQVGLLRPFSSAWIDDGDQLYGQFPKFITWDPKELQISMTTLASTELAKLDKDVWQFHEMELRFKPLAKGKEEGIDTALELKKMQTQTVAWSRNYLHERPACWPAEDNRLVLAWDLSSDTAKEEIKSHPELQPQVNALKNKKKGMLIETVVPETGAPLQQVIIPEVDLTDGWDDIRRAMVSDKFVLVRGEHGNTAIYRMDSGAKVGEFFGLPLATNAAMNLIAASNRANEILLVDEQTGKEIKRFMLGSPVITAHIVAGKDKELFVLTDDQVLHRLPLP